MTIDDVDNNDIDSNDNSDDIDDNNTNKDNDGNNTQWQYNNIGHEAEDN